MITRQSENDLSKYKEVPQASLNILDTTNEEDFMGVTGRNIYLSFSHTYQDLIF